VLSAPSWRHFILATYFIGRRFSSPIIRLKEVAEEITSGDLTKKANIESDNEIGELATAFNTYDDGPA
tara:strand:+ start:56 stop:259 length:204 start_codon:yes stop_codon:yes gene_type:complete